MIEINRSLMQTLRRVVLPEINMVLMAIRNRFVQKAPKTSLIEGVSAATFDSVYLRVSNKPEDIILSVTILKDKTISADITYERSGVIIGNHKESLPCTEQSAIEAVDFLLLELAKIKP